MDLRPFTMPTRDNWVDLELAAEVAGVRVAVVVDAVTSRDIRADTMHPHRLGDWMVPLVDVELWRRRQESSPAGHR